MPGAGSGLFEVAVEPRNDQYHPDDDGWRDQAATLYADLDARVENGAERSVTLTGDALDAETIREIAQAAVAQVGGPPWPVDTGPS